MAPKAIAFPSAVRAGIRTSYQMPLTMLAAVSHADVESHWLLECLLAGYLRPFWCEAGAGYECSEKGITVLLNVASAAPKAKLVTSLSPH